MSERLTMRKIRETLRLHEECGRSQREIASSLSTAVGTICGYLQRARAAGVTWECRQRSQSDPLSAVSPGTTDPPGGFVRHESLG